MKMILTGNIFGKKVIIGAIISICCKDNNGDGSN